MFHHLNYALISFSITILMTLVNLSYSSGSLDSFIYGGCTQVKYKPGSPYESNLNSLLTSLVNSATYSSYDKFTIMGSSQQDVVYGLYQCRGDLSMPDCAVCVARAVSQVGDVCSQTCGGAMQLQGCFIKYDNVAFFGVQDKTVASKRCGPSSSGGGYNNNAAMGHRDAVLAGLGGAGGMYRVGGAEDVQGVAQCVGDLRLGQCQDCLTEAISRVKTDCVGSVYGDVFLAKCYVRYSTSAAHGFGSGPSGHGSSHNGSEKTFAIIIGLLAGVALVIIFLTFISRMFTRNHGKY